MAKYQMELPNEILKDFQKIYRDSDKIFGGMTRAGAEVALKNVKANAPMSEIASHAKLSKTYKTPTDDGINTKVYFSGYLPFSTKNRKYFSRRGVKGGAMYHTTKGVPVSFLVQFWEYGTSYKRGSKRPFFRKSFKKAQIEKAMYDAQKKLSGGLLDE